jgi:topoisomerase IV subunit A
MTFLAPLMRQNFIAYASYVVVDRAIPDLRDGCKPVQRRILHTLSEMDDGKFHKVANVIGECMKLHPHGDASIGDALVVLANKGRSVVNDNLGYFIERQGNFGNELTGDNAAAARYIEARLTPLARETLFNTKLTAYAKSYDGRNDEPEWLPAKLPVVLMLGTEGIAVGMATTILPHNLKELLEAEVKLLEAERGGPQPRLKLYPDFLQGGLMDVSEYGDGRGRIKLRARIEADGDKKVVIREIPFGTTVDSILASIETAIEKGKVKISGMSDRTGEYVEIELTLARGAYADDVIPQLYAYTDCEVSIASNLVVIRDRKPIEPTVTDVLRDHVQSLKDVIRQELELELRELEDRRHVMTLERIFIEHRVYKRIETAGTAEAVDAAVVSGMAPYQAQFVRPIATEDIARLLEIRIKRISQFDIDKHRQEMDEILARIAGAKAKLADLIGTVIAWLQDILARYGKQFPRRTKVRELEEVDKKALAIANLRLGYDAATGFFGSSVKTYDRDLKVSEYDRVIAIFQDGHYKIMAPPEKTVLAGKLVHLGVFHPDAGLELTIVYRDGERCAWVKRCTIASFIKEREYELIKDRDGKVEWISFGPPTGTATAQFAPAKHQKVHEASMDLATIEPCGLTARGTRLGDKPAAKVVVSTKG